MSLQCRGKLWSAVQLELTLLKTRWPILLACLCCQYVHGIFTQLAYRMHTPAATLHDLGFSLLPELPAEWRWLSEALFTVMFVSFLLWTFTPLLLSRAFSCVVLWTRLLTVLVVCQSLRILSFTSTQLPGPAPHCRPGTPTAHRSPARHWWEHVVVDVPRQLSSSCGDLIFSSHMTFVLMGVLTYQHYGRCRTIKALAWAAAVALALLIISARKHYTVDVVIAWYTVPLAYCCLNMYWDRKQPRTLPVQQPTGCAQGVFCHPSCSSQCSPLYVAASSCDSPAKKKLPQLQYKAAECDATPASPATSPGMHKSPAGGAAVITFAGSPAWVVAASPSSALRTPTAAGSAGEVLSSPSRLGAVWQGFGHRRAASSSTSSSSLSRSSWGSLGSEAGGDRLPFEDSAV